MFGLLFLAHADPNVCVENIGTARGFLGILGDDDRGIGAGDQFGGRAIEVGAGEAKLETKACRGPDPGATHVAIGITDEGDLESLKGTAQFLDSQEVGKDLARMLLVGEGIDRRDPRETGEGLDVGLLEGADHRAVDHSTKYAGGVLDRLPAPKLDLAGGEEERLAAELADADLEADTGPGGGFGEEEAPAFAGQGLDSFLAAGGLDLFGKVNDFQDFGGRERLDGEKMLHGKQRSMDESATLAKGRGELRRPDPCCGVMSGFPRQPWPP